jgi:60 kDa SS-A/Ro ribonucleoprotein
MARVNTTHISSDNNVTTSDRLDENQVRNNSGGFTWTVSPLDQLRRFMVLGVTGGTYYQSEKELTKHNAQEIVKLIAKDGLAAVKEIVDFSKNNRAPKKDPSLFALALCATMGTVETRQAAYRSVEDVCNIPTHLFNFVDYCEKLSSGGTGWGRARKRAVANWYNHKSIRDLIYHITKYKQRDGWSNRDLLRLSHAKPVSTEHNLVYKFITKGELTFSSDQVSDTEAFDRLVACDEVQRTNSVDKICQLITDHNLMREHIPTQFLKKTEIWEALLPRMPLNALVRNVGRLTSLGLTTTNSDATRLVLEKLSNKKALAKAKVHPFNALVAFNQYKNGGEGGLGKLRWTPNQQLVKGLNKLFNDSFGYIEPANKRYYIGIDVSGSMGSPIPGANSITCAMGAAAMALTLTRTEMLTHVMAFNNGVQRVDIDNDSTLEQVFKQVAGINWGGTDCSLPMHDAAQRKIPTDVFVVITDNETNPGFRHPAKMLRQYREQMGIDARLVVIAMTSGGFTIADPSDRGMLDMCGFDSSGPRIVRDFSVGSF